MTKGLVLSSFLLSLIGSAAFAAPQLSLNAKDLIRIEIGSDEEDMPSVSQPQQVTYLVKKNSDLRRRVHRLEILGGSARRALPDGRRGRMRR